MNLRLNDFKEEYRTGERDLVKEFYRPCLSNSVRYDRAVGYFRSSVFLLIGSDLIDFAKRGGRVRLICSPCLSEDDVSSIAQGYRTKIETMDEAILRDIDSLFTSKGIAKNSEALATLVSLGVIDIRIAFKPDSQGIYHEKIGMFYDNDNNSVSIKGSINETWNGWHERGNHETIDVFCSWIEGRDARQVKRNKEYFESLWKGEIKGLEVIEFPSVAIEKIKAYAKDSLDDIDPTGLVDYFNVGRDSAQKELNQRGSISVKRTPLPHQLNAIDEWKKQGRRGIFEHATGSGKTFTALTALKEHLDPDGAALVLVPSKLLHQQWAEEINDEIEDIRLLKAGDGNNKWKKDDRLRSFTSPLEGLGKRIVLATMQTARTDMFLNSLDQGEHLMVIADEVHEIGSRENSKALTIEAGPRLGLSATPKRYGDPEGTSLILNYFGPVVQPPYTLADAIGDGRLVPYEYYPKAIRLSAEESEQWAEETEKISKEYARSKRDRDGNAVISSFLQNLIIQRSRIAKRAKAKTPLSVNILRENYQAGESWLVYCEDQFQLREVMDALRDEGFEPLEYHTNMEGSAVAALDYYKKFGGILCSIKCLDQGVDIPKISHAVILASSQNPRQFIQRRGRVLRTCKDKYKAVIFDAIVVPVSLEHEPEQLSLLKSEFQRSIQFAKSALNTSAANELMYLAIQLDIDPEEVGLIDSDGIEKKKPMTEDESNILAVLLGVKERNNLDLNDQLIKSCYELQKKYQYDPTRNTVEKMRALIEEHLNG